MSKIFSFNDKRNGSYIDGISGAVGVNTGGEWAQTEKGLAWRGNGVDAGVAITSTTYNISTDTYSFEFWAKRNNITGTMSILGNTTTGYFKYIIITGSTIVLEGDTNNESISATYSPDTSWHHFVILINNGQSEGIYIDGIAAPDVSTSLSADVTFDLIGNSGGDITPMNGDLGRIQIYDHILTSEERAKLYKEFLDAAPISRKVTDNLDYPALKSHDLSHLVDARIGNPEYDSTVMNVSNCVNLDYTTFANATPTGFDATSDGLDVHEASTAKEIPLVSGKKYIVTFDCILNGGLTAPFFDIREAIAGTWISVEGEQTAVNGFNAFVFTSDTSITGVVGFRNKNTTGNYQITNLAITEWSGEELDKTSWGTYSGGVVTGNKEDGYILTCDGSAWSGMTTADNVILSATDKFYLSITIKRLSGDAGEILYFSSSQVSEGLQLIPTTEYVTFVEELVSFPTTGAFFLLGNTNSSVYQIQQMSVMKVTGLVAAYNMIPSGSTLVDISGEGDNGSIVGAMSTKEGMKFNGSTDWVLKGSTDHDQGAISVLARIKSANLTGRHVFWCQKNSIFLTNGVNLFVEYNSDGGNSLTGSGVLSIGKAHTAAFTKAGVEAGLSKIYLDGVHGDNGLALNFDMDDGIGYIGTQNTTLRHYKGEIFEILVFNYTLSEEEVIAYHNQFAKEVKHANRLALDFGVGDTI